MSARMTSRQVASLNALIEAQHFTDVTLHNTDDGVIIRTNPIRYLGFMIQRFYRIRGDGDFVEVPKGDVEWLFQQ